MEIVDLLAQEALLLDPGNLTSCGRMLSLLDSLDHPAVIREKIILREYLEALIMREIEGGSPDLDAIIHAAGKIQERLHDIYSGESPAAQAISAPSASPATASMKLGSGSGSLPEEDAGLLRDFLEETSEHINDIEINMVEWEKNPDDKEIINSIFRPFHTIKGIAGFLNLHEIKRLSHNLENLLDAAREERLAHSPEASDLIFSGVDALKCMISSMDQALRTGLPLFCPIDLDGICLRLEHFIGAGNIAPGDKRRDPGERSPGEFAASGGDYGSETYSASAFLKAEEYSKKPPENDQAEDFGVSGADARETSKKQAEPGTAQSDRSIKVDTVKLDQLLDMVGELVIAQSMVTQNHEVRKIADPRFLRDVAQLERVTATLQNISMSMRLVPIGGIFRKMNRVVQDISRKSGKKIALAVKGHTAEIDRNMVDELYDPLVHMIRNSCDHGIGTPEERRNQGKPEEGTITLRAEHSGGKVIITISDDGNGLDTEKLIARAVERGFIRSGQLPAERDAYDLIFMPGFSTASQVTEISGRGVGMDVVRKTLEKLRGEIEIHSEKGRGTSFTIKLPLTTAIIDGMLLQAGHERYIIPTLMVRRIIRPERGDVSTLAGKGEIVRVKDKLLPLIRLERALDIEDAQTDPFRSVLIIVEDGGREAALRADALLGKQEVVIKNLGEKFKGLRGVAGGAILGDGKIGLILDVRAIMDSKEASQGKGEKP